MRSSHIPPHGARAISTDYGRIILGDLGCSASSLYVHANHVFIAGRRVSEGFIWKIDNRSGNVVGTQHSDVIEFRDITGNYFALYAAGLGKGRKVFMFDFDLNPLGEVETPHILTLTTIGNTVIAGGEGFLMALDGMLRTLSMVQVPAMIYRIGVNPVTGQVWAAGASQNNTLFLSVLDSSLSTVRELSSEIYLPYAYDICFDSNGNAYVVTEGELLKFRPDGTLIKRARFLDIDSEYHRNICITYYRNMLFLLSRLSNRGSHVLYILDADFNRIDKIDLSRDLAWDAGLTGRACARDGAVYVVSNLRQSGRLRWVMYIVDLHRLFERAAVTEDIIVGRELKLAKAYLAPIYQQIDTVFDRYSCYGVLGAGGFGVALLCRDSETNEDVVLKIPYEATPLVFGGYGYFIPPARQGFFKEAEIISELKHVHIVRLLRWDERPFPYLVFEFCNNGSLRNILSSVGRLPIESVLIMSYQIISALEYAYNRGLMYHGDLKPENILFRDGVLKISDFNIARLITYSRTSRSKSKELPGGTLGYSAPEQFIYIEKPGQRSDVFSLGVIMCECLMGFNPFWGVSNVYEYEEICKNVEVPVGIRELERLIREMLSFKPRNRPTLRKVKECILRLISQYCYPELKHSAHMRRSR
ncbi:MAG: serine/threonine-protein kinase [Crenarchaeota archaeon]|nr:serine/threonine-protein kinase [Thermoproteota archaeon]